LKTAYFLIPGILALIMHMMTILFTSFAIVRERESGTLEQLMATPIRVSDLMIGKVIPYAVIGLADMLLTLAVMVWFFDINISGSFWLLLVNSVVFIVTSLTIGLLISTTCRSQVQAVQLTMGLLLPSMMISGFVFPLEPMPWVIKVFSYLLPITHYLEIIRGVVIKGSGLAELWTYTAILAVLAMVLLIASMVRFKKQVA
jgi:ABC-2 type transport system permease protein